MGKYWRCLMAAFALLLASCMLFSLASQQVSAEKAQETEIQLRGIELGEQETDTVGEETPIQPRGLETDGEETPIQPRGMETGTSDQPVYHAAMGIQTSTKIWIQRWGYFEKSQNEYYDTENYSKLYAAGGVFYDGTFEDVEIKGNGTYTVALKDADFSQETAISQLHIATDIPLEESEKLSFTDVTLEINGNEVLKFDEAVMEDEEAYLQGGAVILLLNHWRDSAKEAAKNLGRSEDASSGWEMLAGSGQDNVSISFTVSGLPYDNEEQAEAETGEQEEESALQETDGDLQISVEKFNGDSEVSVHRGISPEIALLIAIIIFAALVIIVTIIRGRKK